MTGMIDNRTFISWSNYLRDATNNIKEEGYLFNHIGEMDFLTLAHKRDMTYDLFLKHYMPAFEWKLNAMINKNKNLNNKFPQKRRHPINTWFDCDRKNFICILEFVRKCVFYNPNIEDFDELTDKAISDCSHMYNHWYKPLRLIYNIKIVDMKKK